MIPQNQRQQSLPRQASFVLFTVLLVLIQSPVVQGVIKSVPEKIQGIVDDCCCEVEKVDQENSLELNGLLNQIAQRTFFKYFKVNLERECPFWVEQHICGLVGGCQVCECDENEVPLPWRQEQTSPIEFGPGFFTTPQWNQDNQDVWVLDDPNDQEATYVNLLLNVERNTGYVGMNASRIWISFYQENCFSGDMDSMCLEERVFYRIISGLHTLVSTHISENYYDSGDVTYRANIDEYKRRVLDFPERIQNMYFTFLVLLRATHKAMPNLLDYEYNTGHSEDDQQTKDLLYQFSRNSLLCSPNFDETMLFRTPKGEDLKYQFKTRFQNISRLTDCISCQLCKIHAKVQVLGIGTALKILLSDDANISLERNEIIALVNTLRKFSNGIHTYDLMLSRLQIIDNAETENSMLPYYAIPLFFVWFLIIIYFVFGSCCETDPNRKKKQS